MRDSAITRRVAFAGAATGVALVLGGTAGMVPVLGGTAGASTGRKAAVAQARHGLLSLSTFPSGWTSSPNVGAGDSQAVGARQIAACVGVPARDVPGGAPGATSPEFDQTAQDLSVDEEVQVFPTTASAEAAFGVVAAPKAPACAADELNRTATTGAGTSGGTFTVRRLPFPSYGARATALALSLPVTEHGTTLTTAVDDVVLLAGRTEATLTLTSLGSPFPSGLARHLASAAAGRIA